MASMWEFASIRGLIFLHAAQSIDPEELQVLDTFLGSQLVLRASNYHGHTEGSLKRTPSVCPGHTQQSDI